MLSKTVNNEHLSESLHYIKTASHSYKPRTGIILGTGLGDLVKILNVKHILEYSDIPHFPLSTVETHQGKLIFGEISGHPLVVMQGRFHYYEGYSMERISYPLKVMQGLGIKTLILSNACGGVNPSFRKSELMIIRNHINLLYNTPHVTRKNFTKNKNVYDESLIKLAEKLALENNIRVRKGVYCIFQGPNLETRSEYRYARKIGADVVGMSTVPEAITALSGRIKVLGFSIITDMGLPDTLKAVSLPEVIEAANAAQPKLTLLIKSLLQNMN